MLYFKVKLLNQFFPISVGKVSSLHKVVTPSHVLPIVELHYGGEALVH